MARIRSFDLPEGRLLAGKYVVEGRIGAGWEGEVYRVRERHTGIRRAVKLFLPQRNPRNITLRRSAKKLEKLRRCHLVIQYHHIEHIVHDDLVVSCLVSELVEGQVLEHMVKSQRGGRLSTFEALHLLYALAQGVEEIHLAKEYHGDLHSENVLVQREGIFFRPRLFDFFHRTGPLRLKMQGDILDVVRLLYDAVGGPKHYSTQPPFIKAICRGLRSDLIVRRFPTISHLRRYLESFPWE